MKSILHSLLFVLLLLAGKNAHAQLSAGLVAHYPFGGNTDDVSGYANDGIISGTVSLTADRFGTADCAYEFSGDSASYIRIPYDTSLSYASGHPISISLWYKGGTPDFGDFECLFGQWSGPGFYASSYQLYLSIFDVNRATFCERIWEDIATTDTFGTNWHHLVAIYDAGNYQLYKDNALVGTASSASFSASTGYFVMGRTFAGKMDDIRVYNRVISAAEVDSIFNLPGSCEVLGMDEPVQASYTVYPNPTKGLLHIEADNTTRGGAEARVYDITGREVLHRHITDLSAGSIDLGGQPDGVYILKLREGATEKSTLIQKVR